MQQTGSYTSNENHKRNKRSIHVTRDLEKLKRSTPSWIMIITVAARARGEERNYTTSPMFFSTVKENIKVLEKRLHVYSTLPSTKPRSIPDMKAS